MDTQTDDLIQPNGVNGLTGDYLIASVTPGELAASIRSEQSGSADAKRLQHLERQASGNHLGLPFDIDPSDPASAGWGVVFAEDTTPEVRAAIKPLIEHRRTQIGDDKKVAVLEIKKSATWADWLARHGVAPGNIDPTKVPYYLLLVGRPDQISFRMQYLLDVEYCVGRLDFDDPLDYGRYAESVIAAETKSAPGRDRTMQFFGTHHRGDRATMMSARSLVTPLAEGDAAVAASLGHEPHVALGDAASKKALADILTGASPSGRPALLFTATHGLGGWPAGHSDQRSHHGALLCQDWPGGTPGADHFFAAGDLSGSDDVHGLIAFCFACYGAGTPEHDDFAGVDGSPPARIAEEPFVAALPKALLAHQSGGALAVVGHVERVWGSSFFTSAVGPTLTPFRNAIGSLLSGHTIGHAMTDFNRRFATLSANLTTVLRDVAYGMKIDERELASLWAERSDAQNYVVIGDPAVRATSVGS